MSEALEKGDLKGLFVNLKKQVCKTISVILKQVSCSCFDVVYHISCVIQKYTKFANFTGLYFPHFIIFSKTTLQFCQI